MSLRHYFLLALPTVIFCGFSQANECQDRMHEIQRQIDYARGHNNTERVTGLKTAQQEIKANCNEKNLQSEKQQKIVKQQRKLMESQQQLAAAKESGDREKIMKKQRKLDEAKAELQAIQAK